MKFIADNWQAVFGGVGTAVLAAVIGAWAKSKFDSKKPEKLPDQSAKAGANSSIYQSGRDTNVNSNPKS